MATPSIALSVARPEFARFIGAYIGSFTTTTDIAAGDIVISTELIDAGFDEDDSLKDTYFLCTSGDNLDTFGRVKNYDGQDGSLHLTNAMVVQSGSATFELYKYDPTMLRDALNDAASQQFPSLHKRVTDRSLLPHPNQTLYSLPSTIRNVRQVWLEPRIGAATMADNIVSSLDCDLEGSTISDDWTAASATIAYETDTSSPDNLIVFAGNQAGKMTVSSGSTGQAYLTVPSPTGYVGKELHVTVWVYADGLNSTSTVKAAIRTDAGSWTVGTAHAGEGLERLEVTLTDHTIATSIDVGLQLDAVGADQVVYWDELILTAGTMDPVRPYGTPLLDWNYSGNELKLPEGLTAAYQLALVGVAPLESFTTQASTMTLNRGPHVNRLYAAAAALFFQQDIDQLGTDELNAAQRRETHYRNRVESLSGHMAMPALMKAPVYA